MIDYNIITFSLSYRTMASLSRAVLNSFFAKVIYKCIFFTLETAKKAFLFSETRTLLISIYTSCKKELYGFLQLVLVLIILFHLILDKAAFGRIHYMSVAILLAFLLAVRLAGRGFYKKLLPVIMASTVFRVFKAKL